MKVNTTVEVIIKSCQRFTKLVAIATVVLVSSLIQAQPAGSRDDAAANESAVEVECTFADLSLPDDFVVYAAGEYSGVELPIQIDQSGSTATEIQVYVNESDKPVVLMLGAYSPTVWQIKWTEQTHIVAVYASGFYAPIVAGLNPSTPVLVAGKTNRCDEFYITEEKLHLLNPIARKIFHQPVTKAYIAEKGIVYVGPRVDEKDYQQAVVKSSESFRLPGTPLAGEAGLEEAVRQGILRPATEADFQAWFQIRTTSSKTIERDFTGEYGLHPSWRRNAYVILKPFQIPVGLYGGHSAHFILAEGAPVPAGSLGHSVLLDMNDGSCSGRVCSLP